MSGRHHEVIANAEAEGKRTGRMVTARAKSDEVKKLRAEGLRATEIAKRLGIGGASI